MRPIITLLLCSLFSFSVFSQTEISGRVLNSKTRKPVDAATVTLHPVGSATILSYTMTVKDGAFTLKSAAMPDSVTVSVRAMTIESQSKTVKGNVGFVEFLVKENVTELKEVIVQAPKIRQLGDTIHYDVSSFLDETDRSIGDVLKKLPGVQVLSSGQIMYQNKAISKFYVEGLDLLKGKYGIATNNIDAKNVASV
ncbi:MAG: carboxypeptidase-like regulatory domain-containing protein, partial [Oscillospiraceae bacterium]|nr:carboxypeptidase-like regulatory domain-containing protein [Oscillospiraceae bacterium]